MLSSPVSEKVPPLVGLSVCEPLQKDQPQQQVVLSIAEDSLTSETDSLSYLADDSVDVIRCPVCKVCSLFLHMIS